MAKKAKRPDPQCSGCGERTFIFSFCPDCPAGPFCEDCRNAHNCGDQPRLPGIRA